MFMEHEINWFFWVPGKVKKTCFLGSLAEFGYGSEYPMALYW